MKNFVVIFCLTLAFLFFCPYNTQSFSGDETIYSASKYILQDNDTETSGTRICRIQAKRRILDKAKIYLRSGRPAMALSDDEFSLFAPAILQFQTIKEDVTVVDDKVVVTVSLKTVINRKDFISVLAKLDENKPLKKKIAHQQGEIRSIEEKILSLREKLKNAEGKSVISLLRERDSLLAKLKNLESRAVTREAAGHTAERTLRDNFQFD